MTLFLLFVSCAATDDASDGTDPVVDDSGAPPDDTSPDDTGTVPVVPVPDDILAGVLSRGPQAPGGGVRALTQNPAMGYDIYLGTETNAIWRTSTDFDGWEGVPAELLHIRSEVAVSPSAEEVLLWGGGRYLLRRAEGQTLFIDVPEATESREFWAATFHASEPGRAFIVNTAGELLESLDSGLTWSLLSVLPLEAPPPHVQAMQFQWRLQAHPSGDERLLFMTGESEPLQSDDGGATWSSVVAAVAFPRATFWVRGEPILYVGVSSGLLRSLQDGDFETVISAPGEDLEYAAASDDGSFVIASTRDRYWASTDGGDSFVAYESPSPFGIRSLLVTRGDDPDVVLGTEEGLYLSRDLGETWSAYDTNLTDLEVTNVTPHPTRPDVAWIGTECGRGYFKGDTYGETWTHEEDFFHYTMQLVYAPSDPLVLWATNDDVVRRSTDGGDSWVTVSETMADAHVHGIAVHPDDAATALVGTVGSGEDADRIGNIYLTEDAGQTWTAVNGGLTETDQSIEQLMYWPGNAEVVLAGTYKGEGYDHPSGFGIGLFRSADGGRSWALAALDALDIADIAAGPDFALAATENGIFRSDDLGVSWTGLPTPSAENDPWVSVAVSPVDPATFAVLTDRAEVYVSRDAGVTWAEVPRDVASTNQVSRTLAEVAFSADGVVLYMVEPITGVWRTRME